MRIVTDKELRMEALKYVAGAYPPYMYVEQAEVIFKWLKTGKIEKEEPDDTGD